METFRRVSGPVVLAACLAIFSSAATATETKPAINLDIAKKMIAACEAKAKQEGWKMNVAIVDDGANLVAFERMDGTFPSRHAGSARSPLARTASPAWCPA